MKERIKSVRKALNLTQENFGEKLGVRKTAISKLENGENNLTEQMQKLICNEFNVNEEWLRTGNGEMFNQMDRDEELAYLMGKILASKNDFIKQTMLTFAKLDESDWDLIENLIKKIKDSTNQ
ncbi:helix-turn-helix domain-containing protein [Cellulosilyticum lentocellum]|uniref:Helix-turn-helix domain protein n=1 Tax=Cellulosilyticum lentocellum (strain ATCC 49066 / DSM 5427 / NCIMB 11756 / RHM5) TaxID=642492 RepID=F2JNV3_CELLD|nr:helix-turn-helix transcriptional regulator [Cellulosilyticum lentocellum]ADZ82451.1 helix-turn-helix domain protein [Cellulosilyticum lentocellum DSM 5427]